jgi:putative effector of murein hydrolase
VVAGTLTSMATVTLIVDLMHGPRSLVLSMIFRGVTTPLAMQLAEHLGGVPTLGAIFTGVSGLPHFFATANCGLEPRL